MTEEKKLYYAAVYLRLSKEDGDKEESNSITNQRAIIYDFLKTKPEIKVVAERIDDGFSGGNFIRPAFQNMIQDMEEGKINCIIVKDLSRFSRNYLDAGQYLEYVFPQKKVRFLAVTDGVDTLEKNTQNDSILLPFKNLMNDYYIADISRKTRSSLEMKRKQGDYVSAFAVYGYQKEKQNKNKLVIDEAAAEVVLKIFRWKLKGMSNAAIANKLNLDGILSPLEYKNAQGIRLNATLKKRSVALWHPQTIDYMLKNEIYTGVLEQGKVTTINYKLKKPIKKKKQQWVRVENTHEPIVPKWMFDAVSRIMQSDTRSAPGVSIVYPFSGMLYCGDCGNALIKNTIHQKEKSYTYFVCSYYKQNKNNCTSHRIKGKELQESVIHSIAGMAESWIQLEEFLMKLNLDRSQEDKQIQKIELEAQIKNNQKKNKKLSNQLATGVIDESDYLILKRNYDEKCNVAKDTLKMVKEEICSQEKKRKQQKQWMNLFLSEKKLESFDRLFFVMFLEQIEVCAGNQMIVSVTFQDEYKTIF